MSKSLGSSKAQGVAWLSCEPRQLNSRSTCVLATVLCGVPPTRTNTTLKVKAGVPVPFAHQPHRRVSIALCPLTREDATAGTGRVCVSAAGWHCSDATRCFSWTRLLPQCTESNHSARGSRWRHRGRGEHPVLEQRRPFRRSRGCSGAAQASRPGSPRILTPLFPRGEFLPEAFNTPEGFG